MVSLGRVGLGECDDEETAVLVLGLGRLAAIVVVLVVTAEGASESTSIATDALVVGTSEKAGASSLGVGVGFVDCCDGTGSGGDKRGRLESGGEGRFVSPSRLVG